MFTTKLKNSERAQQTNTFFNKSSQNSVQDIVIDEKERLFR